MKMILLGPPAAGKGTQSAYLSEYYNIPAISTGSIIRRNISEGTELGKQAKSYIEAGKLVPDRLIIDLVINRLTAEDCREGFILDGFPRTVPQAEALDKNGIDIDKVVEFNVPDEEIIERISGRRSCKECGAIYHIISNPSKKGNLCEKCGGELVQRADDTAKTVRSRLEVYHKETEPVSGYYKQKGNLVTVDGAGRSVEQTSAAMWKALGVKK